MGSGGYRPEASQNDPYSVSPNGGNGQSGKFVAEKVAKATQLRPSGYSQYQRYRHQREREKFPYPSA